MGPLTFLLVSAAVVVSEIHSVPEIEPDDFRGWFLSSYDGTLELEDEIRARASRMRFVFVLGLMNERSPGYVEQNVKELVALGVPREQIHRIAPSSDLTFRENLDSIRLAFRSIADRGPEPLVIIGHSRGACDSLAFALREPEFVADRIVAMFLLQGPFGGSGAADYLLGGGIPMDREMPRPARAIANVLRSAEAKQLERGKHNGIIDLTSDAAGQFWERMINSRAESIPIVSPRAFYIESSAPPSRQPLLRRPVAKYLETYYGPNDGLVVVGNQYLEGVGTRLGILDVGHTDLTHRFPAARPQRKLRRALIEAIVMAVGRPARFAGQRSEFDPRKRRIRSGKVAVNLLRGKTGSHPASRAAPSASVST